MRIRANAFGLHPQILTKKYFSGACRIDTASQRHTDEGQQIHRTQIKPRILPTYSVLSSSMRMFQSGSQSDSSVQISVSPTEWALVDDKLAIKVNGLREKQPISIYARLKEGRAEFESVGNYTADDNGEVDVQKCPSLSGSYKGISTMGLFTHMAPTPGQMTGLRLFKKEIPTPLVTELSVYDGHQTTEEVRAGSVTPITQIECRRWYQGPGVTRIPVKTGRLRGALYLPAGPGPFQGVIDIFGTAGGLLEFRSALLASRGFASLALAYFAYDDLTTDLTEIDLDYFLEAVDWMCSHSNVIPGGIGAIGVSKGGELALAMALESDKVTAVVNISSPTFISSVDLLYSKGTFKSVELDLGKAEYGENNSLSTVHSLNHTKEDILPIWKTNAKILNTAGDNDKCCTSESMIQLRDMYPADRKSDCQVVVYPGAGHLIEPPYMPLCSMSYHKLFDMRFLWGGFPDQHAVAQEDSWQRILTHFRNNLPKPYTDMKSKL